MQISPVIDKIASRLSAHQKMRTSRESSSALEDADEDCASGRDEVDIIDEVVTTSRKHPLSELPPLTRQLSSKQVSKRDVRLKFQFSWKIYNTRICCEGVAQWLGRRSLVGGLYLPCARSMVDR